MDRENPNMHENSGIDEDQNALKNPRTSEILSNLLASPALNQAENPEKIPLNALVQALGPRAFGILFLLFGLPNCFPLPPGVSFICGLVVMIIAVQMMMGKDMLVLPKWLGVKQIERKTLAMIIQKSSGMLKMLERLAKPRLGFLFTPLIIRVIGVIIFALGFQLLAPIPFFGGMPPGFALTLLGLALTEKDGGMLIAGFIATALSTAIIASLTWAVVQGAGKLF